MPDLPLDNKDTGWTLAAALLLAPLSAQALFGCGMPHLQCPLPLPLLVPALTAIPPKLAIAIPTVAFCFWARPCFRRAPIPRRRTAIAFAILTLASIVHFVFGWKAGFDYQGYNYTLGTAILSAAFIVLIGVHLLRRANPPLFSVWVNFLLFLWAFTYAFPYLGELI